MHRLGAVVDVRLVEALPAAGALRFELLSEGDFAPIKRRREGTKARPAQRRRASGEKGRKQEHKKSGKARRGKSWKA
jgi:ribonuclease R